MDPSEPNEGSPPPRLGDVDVYADRVRAQEVFEFAPSGEIRTDAHGVIIEANHAAAGLCRCPKEFLLGKPLGLFVAEGFRRRFYSSLARLARGLEVDTFDSRLARGSRSPRDVNLVVTPRNEAGGKLHWLLTDVTDWKRAEAARDDLLRRLVTAQEDERRRVSRELHDSVGQLLTGLSLAIKAAREAVSIHPAAETRLAEVQRVADELGRVVHDLAVRLRPTALDDVGLHAALSQHLTRWSAQTGVAVDYEGAVLETERLPADVETAVYRVVQEALTNVARHARAVRVSVAVSRHEGHAVVAVEDDGVGFDPETVSPGRLGLVGMRERVTLVSGTLEVESRPGGGTTVLARFPVITRQDGGGLPDFLADHRRWNREHDGG